MMLNMKISPQSFMDTPLTDEQLKNMYESGYIDFISKMPQKCYKRCVQVSTVHELTDAEKECIHDCCYSYMFTVDSVFGVFQKMNKERRGD